VRLLDIACGPAWGCELLPGGVGFGFFRAYLVVGHVFFDDHFEFETPGVVGTAILPLKVQDSGGCDSESKKTRSEGS
jgi:hypothetical protein